MIKQKLTDWGLQLDNCRRQTYDGAGNMAGYTNGAAALITKDYPKDLYTHCACHFLNLVLSQCTKLQLVRNMIDISERVVLFFNNSLKRNDNLQHWICRSPSQQSPSYWILARLDSSSVMMHLVCLLSCTQLLWLPFRIFLPVENSIGIVQQIIGLSRKLQGRTEDVISAFQSVDDVRGILQDTREHIEERFGVWHEEAVSKAESVDVTPALPRRCGRQRNRDNTPADTTETYYRRVLAVPYIDDILMGLKQQFSTTFHSTASSGRYLVPAVAVTRSPEQLLQDLESFIEFYRDDLPSPHGVRTELERWLWRWKSASDVSTTAAATIKLTNRLDFPNIFALLKLVCTMGVTTCECERSNSELRLLQTYLCSTMGEDRLNGLAFMPVHYGMELPLDDIVNRFARKHPRRMKLGNIFD